VKTFFKENRSILFLALGFFVIRLLVSFGFELGTDEAHYILYGRHLALSYFDHPPLVGWIQNLFLGLSTALPINVSGRIPALFCSIISTLLVNEWLLRKGYSEKSRIYALFALNTAILFSALSLFFLPDTLLLILVPLLSLSVENLMSKKSFANWIIFGFVIGLAGITKYTAILFLLPLIWYWIKSKSLRDLKTPSFWSAVFLAAICISPVLIWNLQHDFISFKYQSGHVISFANVDIKSFLISQASQFIGLSFIYFYCFPKPKTIQDRFDLFLMITPLIFLSFFALFGNFLPHWTAPFFVLAVPWGVAENLRFHQGHMTKKLKAALIAASILFIFIHLELGLHVLPFSASKDLQRDIQGWQAFTQRSLMKSKYDLAVTNWTFGSRVKLYSELAGRKNVIVLDHRTDQFDLWSADEPATKNILILAEKKNEIELLESIHCASQINLGEDGPIYKDHLLVHFDLIECTGFTWK
jgi:4-amino-4-deoxy-L-arabinose transferase-like glycosyltransferase